MRSFTSNSSRESTRQTHKTHTIIRTKYTQCGRAARGGVSGWATYVGCLAVMQTQKNTIFSFLFVKSRARRIELEMPTVKVRKEFSIEFFTSLLLRGPANKYCDCRRPLSLEFDVASRHKKSIKRNKSRDYDQEEMAFVPRLYIFWIIDLKDDKKKKRDIIWSCIV